MGGEVLEGEPCYEVGLVHSANGRDVIVERGGAPDEIACRGVVVLTDANEIGRASVNWD